MKNTILSFMMSLLFVIPVYSIDKATFKVGKNFFDKQLYSEAEKRFLDIVRKYPDSPLYQNSLFYLGNTYAHMGQYKSALQYYKLLLSKSRSISSKQQALLGIAKSWLQLGVHDKAGDFYAFFASEYPESQHAPAALYFSGIARERNKEDLAAVEKYRVLLEKYPNSKYYSKAIEKIAVLENNTPETLWASTSKTDNTDLSTNAWIPGYANTELKAQDPQALITPINISPITAETNLQIVAPQVITQYLASPVITQQIASPPVVITQIPAPQIITQKVTQVVTQRIETPIDKSSVSSLDKANVVQRRNNVFIPAPSYEERLKQEELEQYKKIWQEEYLQKQRTEELQRAQEEIKSLMQLSEEKAQVLSVKEQSLQEKQDKLQYDIYTGINGIPAYKEDSAFNQAPSFTIPESVVSVTNTNSIASTNVSATNVATPVTIIPTTTPENTTSTENNTANTDETPVENNTDTQDYSYENEEAYATEDYDYNADYEADTEYNLYDEEASTE